MIARKKQEHVGRVLSLCDRTGNMVLPWAEAGYVCDIVDINPKPEPIHPNIIQHRADVFAMEYDWPLMDGAYDIAFAFPPCTDLTVAGARWFEHKGIFVLRDAIALVAECVKLLQRIGCPWMLENPVGVMNHYWPPQFSFDPCDYAGYHPDGDGDRYTKKTCIWFNELFTLPMARRGYPNKGSKMHLLPPSDDRADLRSETPLGFAYAVFAANRTTPREIPPMTAEEHQFHEQRQQIADYLIGQADD